jgi:hypothetical protein
MRLDQGTVGSSELGRAEYHARLSARRQGIRRGDEQVIGVRIHIVDDEVGSSTVYLKLDRAPPGRS